MATSEPTLSPNPDTTTGGSIMSNIYDYSSMGNDATANTAVVNYAPRLGYSCLEFVGANYVTIPRSAMITTAMTVNLWAYMDDWSVYGNNTMRLYSCTQNGGYNIESNSGYIQFAMYDSGVGYKSATSTKSWSDLTSGWHMFTQTFDGTYNRGYVDGECIAGSEAFTSGLIGYNASNTIILGGEAGDSTIESSNPHYFTGKIDDFKIYASALSDEDILKEYNTRAYISNKGEFLVGWIDETTSPTSTSLVDKSGDCYPDEIIEMGRNLKYLKISQNGTICFSYLSITKPDLTERIIYNSEYDMGVNTITISMSEVTALYVTYASTNTTTTSNLYNLKIEGSLDNSTWFTIWDSGDVSANGFNNVTSDIMSTGGHKFIVECDKTQITKDNKIIASEFIEI